MIVNDRSIIKIGRRTYGADAFLCRRVLLRASEIRQSDQWSGISSMLRGSVGARPFISRRYCADI
ncbi:hypothetical protein WG78_21190 [Amantichitinum ursilacus]|uniref:Uncharacterized protein n=1 Tax=Amantichitinum ursilacus TaxID=857265 RepID=A0A0N0GKM8_9NEIS|nr:hypothetical protein WG78_21190 [Amantichitinum ursilacus]